MKISQILIVLWISLVSMSCTSLKNNSQYNGCFASSISSHFSSSGIQFRKSSGNVDFDNLLINEIVQLENTFRVYPKFSFFDESVSIGPNALATSEKLLSQFSDGTVLFGIRFINKIQWYDNGEINVMTPLDLRVVLAHEYAHIFQLRLADVWNMPTAWRELQADFLASWHIAKYIGDNKVLQSAAYGLYRVGDLDFTNPQHHGTHSQRLVMGIEGATFAKEYPYASPYDAANMAAKLLIRRGNRVMVQATRQWFEGDRDL